MQWGDLLQEPHPASQPCRQKLPLRFLVGPGDQMSRVGFFIEAVAGSYPEIDQPVQLVLSQANEIADHVGDESQPGVGALLGVWKNVLIRGQRQISSFSVFLFPVIAHLRTPSPERLYAAPTPP